MTSFVWIFYILIVSMSSLSRQDATCAVISSTTIFFLFFTVNSTFETITLFFVNSCKYVQTVVVRYDVLKKMQ